jgi:pilus assembly protein Flp/PilA
MTNMKNLIARFVRDEQGQDLIEYALLAGFISLAVVTAVTNVGTALNTLYGNVQSKVNDAAS